MKLGHAKLLSHFLVFLHFPVTPSSPEFSNSLLHGSCATPIFCFPHSGTFPSYGVSQPYNPTTVSSLACNPVAKYFSYPCSKTPLVAEGCPVHAGDAGWPLGLQQNSLTCVDHVTSPLNGDMRTPSIPAIYFGDQCTSKIIHQHPNAQAGRHNRTSHRLEAWRIHFPGAKIFHTSTNLPSLKRAIDRENGKKMQ